VLSSAYIYRCRGRERERDRLKENFKFVWAKGNGPQRILGQEEINKAESGAPFPKPWVLKGNCYSVETFPKRATSDLI
jgi:hypothetical protein